MLSVVWGVVLVVALVVGPVGLAVVFGAVGGVAATQSVRVWRQAGLAPSRAVAGLGPLVAALLAVPGPTWAGIGVLVFSGASLAHAVVRGGPGGPLATVGATLRCGLLPTVVAVAVVLLAGIGWAAVAFLVVCAIAYDVGNHLWSADTTSPVAGPVAGMVSVGVATLAFTVLHTVFRLEPFGPTLSLLVFGGLAAVLSPLGPLVASATLPAAGAPAAALRRIDSLAVAAPVWLVTMWGYLG